MGYYTFNKISVIFEYKWNVKGKVMVNEQFAYV
jgi:hypothetical protein